jgi:chorismate mutase
MNTLSAVRAQLDAIDDSLHDLLMQRAAIVDGLASSRAKSGTILRPGREADILRRLLARHAGPLPRAALVRLWRELFAASIQQQGGFSVAVYAREPAMARLVPEHFGALTAARTHPTPSRALAAVTRGEASVAVLPFPEDADAPEMEWWPALNAPQLSVVARLPFFADGEAEADALVVAPGAPDPSEHDLSLLLLESDSEQSRGQLLASLTAAGITARLVLVRRAPGISRFLMEADGLIMPDDARLRALPFDRARMLGAYAAPLRGFSA